MNNTFVWGVPETANTEQNSNTSIGDFNDTTQVVSEHQLTNVGCRESRVHSPPSLIAFVNETADNEKIDTHGLIEFHDQVSSSDVSIHDWRSDVGSDTSRDLLVKDPMSATSKHLQKVPSAGCSKAFSETSSVTCSVVPESPQVGLQTLRDNAIDATIEKQICEPVSSVEPSADSAIKESRQNTESIAHGVTKEPRQNTESSAHGVTKEPRQNTESIAHGVTKEPRQNVESSAQGVINEMSEKTDSEVSDKPVKYKCLKCSRVMKDKRLIENHSCDNETEEDKIKISITLDVDCKSFLCKECNYSNSGHNFEEHLMCHLMVRPYQCLYCKECFINRKEISRHVLKSHNGAKMSCALRALRKAKALIKEVTASGTISFMAKVAGKVPLEKDPDKKKKLENGQTSASLIHSDQNPTESAQCGQNITPAGHSHKDMTGTGHIHQDMTETSHCHQDMTGTGHSHKDNALSDQSEHAVTSSTVKSHEKGQDTILSKLYDDDYDDRTPESSSNLAVQNCPDLSASDQNGQNMIGSCSSNYTEFTDNIDLQDGNDKALRPHQMLSHHDAPENVVNSEIHPNPEHQQSCQGFSKLREVLTLGSSELKANSCSETGDNSDSERSCSDSGLKIVASFSLKNMTDDGSDFEKTGGECVIESGFIVTSEQEKEPEVLSFLGRFTSVEGFDASLPSPPPPSLQPTVVSCPNRMSVAKAGGSSRQHESNHHFFVCGFNCLFSSISATEFKEHTMNFHSSEAFFPCYYCGHRSPNETDLVRHISNHTQAHNKSVHLYVCGNDGCRFGSNLVADYIGHFKTAHPDIHEPMCYSCGDTFSNPSMLQTHVESNVIHIVNCPHCSSKATDRKVILNHISSTHPGKPKMVSVAKQLICHDRKMNSYEPRGHHREMPPPTLTPAPAMAACSSVVDQVINRHHLAGDESNSLSKSRDTPSPMSSISSPSSRRKESTPERGKSPHSDSSDFGSAKVKEEYESTTAYVVDVNGIRRRVYVPMSERQAENYRCRHCTFIARDFKRMHCHEKSHGMPPTKKERFKCMFCPQGFDSELKFRLHITCHPGLIKFLLYRCKKCEFDTNQKHTMMRHITCNKDRKHRGFGPVEDQYTVVSRSLESRVMECDRCDYMTRHKIHMTLHYQKKHNILKDRSEFTVEGITPTDTPLSTYDLSPQIPQSLSPYTGFRSPDISQDNAFDFPKPSGSVKKSKDSVRSDSPVITLARINERNDVFNRMVSHQAALQPGHVAENQMRKFKCPICRYLLPKAADLKNHVKRHSEIGQITLIIFRCRYCSCMSTARELLYEHLVEKHPGKPIALVKKIVAIDTMDVDKSFAETTMEETLDQLEEQLHKEILSNLTSKSSMGVNEILSPKNYEQVFVIPEGEEIFGAPLQCPKCPFSSFIRSEIVFHVNSLHSEIRVIGSEEALDSLVRATADSIHIDNALSDSSPVLASQEEVLIVPDDQIFKEPALCSRCDFSTLLRRDMVIHLQQNHPEIAVMGRNSFPVQVTAMGYFTGPMDESCIVGSGSLDAKLRCLYENYGTQMKCLICGTERPKKFFIHVHILRHLNIYLWKCAFCAHRGLQKYKMVDHIKKVHPGKPLSVRYLRVNVDAKVAQFLEQFNTLKRCKDDTIATGVGTKSPGPSGSTSPHSLGSDELDEKISCLYDNCGGVTFKCIACHNQFQRKFAIHRHIIMSHLKVALLACAYCGMEGVERHQIVDHILACHRPAPVNILPLDIDLHKSVSEFLTKLAAGELRGVDMFDQKKASKKTKMGSLKLGKSPGSNSLKKHSTVDPDVLLLGRYALDQELGCLYQERPSGQLRCLVCRWEFPKKYPLHRHIMLKHLKMNLLGCPYCPFEGIEKYNISVHIKELHGGKALGVKLLDSDVRGRVKKFVEDMTSTGAEDLERNKKESVDSSLLIVPKVEINDEERNGPVNEEEGNGHVSEEEGERKKTADTVNSGLVVAMFGKKKQQFSFGNVHVKTEIHDKDFKDSSNIPAHDNDGKKEQYSPDEDDEGDVYTAKVKYKSPKGTKHLSSAQMKHLRVQSLVSESYRSPAGGKPKALDVITKIKVLKAKEGQIVKFYCEMCKFTSLHRSNVVRHIYKIHEKYQTQVCPLCTYQTLSPMLMYRHAEKEHPGLDYKPGSSKQAHPKLTRKPKMGPLSFQKRRQSLVSEPHSQKTSSSAVTISCSTLTLGPKQYACAYCHYETSTQEDILRHTRINHSQGEEQSAVVKSPNSKPKNTTKKAVKRRVPDEDEAGFKRKRKFIFEKSNELIQCGHCDTKETTMSRMQDHLTWDHPGLPFQAKRIPAWRFICKSCSVKTMATSKMKYHLNRHVNYRPYTCVDCAAFFPSPDQCRRHSRSQAHTEQYTYVRALKKEARVAELLEGTRQLALQVQDEASKDPDFDISKSDTFIAKFQEFKGNLKRSIPGVTRKLVKKAKGRLHDTANNGGGAGAGHPRKQTGKSAQTVGVEQDVTIKCYNCEFTSSNVSSVKVHHNQEHPGTKFLWTELERGFTCDSSGEALPECDSVPCTSTDVGYTTRMTLGAGSNTMRFKCKTCDFSSCVIQAMKSHLKSHQPKGFMCPYCSRSFSGKEKLMRHQYCLHKGLSLWVIHLRMAGVVGSTAVKKGKGVPADDSAAEVHTDSVGTESAPKTPSGGSTVFLCSECAYTTGSLYHFRLHLAQQHPQFRHKTCATSPDTPLRCASCSFVAETEIDLSIHAETHSSTGSFQCGYCDYNSADRSSVQCHLAASHGSLDPKILHQRDKGEDKISLPLLVNLEPNILLERVSDSVLTQYSISKSEDDCALDNEEEDDHMDEAEEEKVSVHTDTFTEATSPLRKSSFNKQFDDDDDDDERLIVVEDPYLSTREAGTRDGGRSGDDNDDGDDINKAELAAVNSLNLQINEVREFKKQSNNLQFVGHEQFCSPDLYSDVTNTQFDTEVTNQCHLPADEGIDDGDDDVSNDDDDNNSDVDDDVEADVNDDDSEYGVNESDKEDIDGKVSTSQDNISTGQSRDLTLLAAQDKDSKGSDDEGEVEDEDMDFDNDTALSSPLPMISLGDGVAMSPVNMEIDDAGIRVEQEHFVTDSNSERLLDV
ncbi:unnamed protein product [Candidula unifasciata]|uniref:C2H2-type domain-containing protein n=1 Tax=Candidula unifasciata TaxID=100452 RepID=A0A8S3Z087_9EUPU|nr:unnamed protein product [Candidula unifasciata]